ncbi:coenzyme A pyrophosphatase [Pilimelia anulata]|uniref:Coenzyme A pyrophosphatase n=1 Tax=Pilimelia anulata TaxID=53371 RepID=A0A8J3B5K5_9ACTN|nr:CoA pyrophosphatase [Pilimelia anulata]GGJ97130.1 coenzyme A pyrophosphatase [Pilimelia anulata]
MSGPAGRPPGWWEPLLSRVRDARTEDFTSLRRPEPGGRDSAVLVLFAQDDSGEPDVLIIQRPRTMRTHAGQPAFPGGAAEPADADPPATALREAGEEVGLCRDTVTVLATLPELWIPVSDFVVTPVLAWWHAPHDLHAVQVAEVARVARVRVADLADPANRRQVRHPSGWVGPAFAVSGMLIWGFTAGVLSRLLELGGWARPWSADRLTDPGPYDAPAGPPVVGSGPDTPVP